MANNVTVLYDNRWLKASNPNHSASEVMVTPLAYKLGLFLNNTGMPSGNPTGEVSSIGTGYQRMPVTFNDNMENAEEILFPQPTADWGTATHYCIFAEVSAGAWEAWWYGQLTNPITGLPQPITIVNGGARAWVQALKLKIDLV